MVIVRLGRGIHDHFHTRLTEWIMAYAAIGMWLAFQAQPNMLVSSPSFFVLERWAHQPTWSALVLSCGLARLVALTVNGTFQSFRYSPHLRVAASLLGIAFWSQFTLGFIIAFLEGPSAFSAVIAYSTFCLAELANVYRSWSDIGAMMKRDHR